MEWHRSDVRIAAATHGILRKDAQSPLSSNCISTDGMGVTVVWVSELIGINTK